MGTISWGELGLCVVVATVALAGCTGEVGEPTDFDGAETVDETELELHEAACWTQAPAHAVVTAGPVQPGWNVAVASAASSDGAYTAAGCPNQWIVEVRGIRGRAFEPYGDVPDLYEATGQAACEGYWGFAKVKGFRPYTCTTPQPCGGVWQDLMTERYWGSWEHFPWPIPGDSCVRFSDFPGPVSVGANHPYTKIRIVTQAGWALAFVRAAGGALVQ